MIQKLLDIALVLLLVCAVVMVAYQMLGDPIPPEPNAPAIVEPDYRNRP